jgi:hypothetical protein
MQAKLRLASLILFGLVSLFLIWFGFTYATVKDMLWFHAAAVPDAVRSEVRPLYFALMTLIGGSSTALGVLGAYVIVGPLRNGSRWAATTLTFVFALAFVMAAITAEKLSATGAPTSWHIMGVLLAITGAGYLSHVAATHGARPHGRTRALVQSGQPEPLQSTSRSQPSSESNDVSMS